MKYLCLDCDYITVGLPKCGSCLSNNTQQAPAIHPTRKCKCGCGNNVNFNEKKGKYSEYMPHHNKARLGTGESIINEKGYRKLRVDGKYQFEHRMVMEVFLGRKLTQDEQVHHVNGDRLDNRIENLQLFPNAKAHSKLCYDVHQNHAMNKSMII